LDPGVAQTPFPGPRPSPGPDAAQRRRRLVLVVLALLAAGAAAFLLLRGGEGPGATGAARFVPDDALAYIHVSTDPDREGVERAVGLGNRFPGFGRLRAAVLSRLASAGRPVDFERDIRPWLGDEAALALLNTRGTRAGSLIVLGVADRTRAQRFVRPPGRERKVERYRGAQISRYGDVATAFVGDHLLIGQEAGLRQAIDVGAGRGTSLDDNPTFRRAMASLPEGRVADVYAPAAGMRRLLRPEGLPGAVRILLDKPALAGTAAAVTAEERRARLTVHSVLDPALARREPAPSRPFEPALERSLPIDALAYLGTTGLGRAVGRILGLAQPAGFGDPAPLVARLRRDLVDGGVDLQEDLAPLFRREVALVVTPSLPAPALTLVAAAGDEDATALAVSKLQEPLAELFAPSGAGPGQVPTFTERDIGGVKAFSLRLAPGLELNYAVFEGKLVVSTQLGEIQRVRNSNGYLSDDDDFQAVMADRPKRVSSLVFLDFRQLLRLGERTGLGQDPAYLAVRPDLQKIRAVGAASTPGKNYTTVELVFDIP